MLSGTRADVEADQLVERTAQELGGRGIGLHDQPFGTGDASG
jgi:hypothetical protein